DRKIGVKRADRQAGHLRQPNQTSIGERHRHIGIAIHRVAQRRRFLSQLKSYAQNISLDCFDYTDPRQAIAVEQEASFGDDRLASNERLIVARKLRDGPIVENISRIEIRDQRSRIHHDAAHHLPKSSKYFLFVDKSVGPSGSSKIKSFSRSCAVTRRGLAS